MALIDAAIICLYFLFIFILGIWQSQKVRTVADFATGGKSYNAFFIFATLFASFIGGGFTTGLAEETFNFGLIYVMTLWGFSLKEIFTAYFIAPRISQFKHAQSVGDIMGELYGRNVKIFTGIASLLVCAGITGAQFTAFGYFFQEMTGAPFTFGILACALIVITYSTLGGIKAVITNDVVHFCVLIIALPLVLIFTINKLGGLGSFVEITYKHHVEDPISITALIGLFLSFFLGETLVPPYVQRLLIGKTTRQTIQGTLFSGVVSFPFFLIIGLIGVAANYMDSSLDAHLAMPFTIKSVMPAGFKGIALAGMAAVIISSADSFLNAASVGLSHDVLKSLKPHQTKRAQLFSLRLCTAFVGVIGLIFSLSIQGVLDILLFAYNFWTPFILVPLIAGIYNIRTSQKGFWLSSFVGISVSLIVKIFGIDHLTHIDSAVFGVLANLITFCAFLYKKPSFIVIFPEGKKSHT